MALVILGWRVTGNFPRLARFVVIVAPHTSNWDFVVGIAAKLALGLRVTFLGKDSLFRFPLGVLMRFWGGVPIDRSASNDVVRSLVDEFARREKLVLAIAPEGTRTRVDRWRTGFYHIAHAARLPIVTVALNFGAKEIQIGAPFTTTGDANADIDALRARFVGVHGRRRAFG
jgi:1-acyl-sn-glycerol-3-phosphate acyltransferase